MTTERYSIICFSSIDWEFNWQGHQEIMAALAAQGHRVLFVENTGVRAPSIRDLPRLKRRLRNWWRSTKGFRQERENVVVYSPVLLPFPYFRLARWINRFLLARPLRRWVRVSRFYRPIVWTFLPTPLVRDLIQDLDPALVVYYCIDSFAQSSAGARRIISSERKLLAEADLVFVTSKRLLETAATLNPNVHLFPFGVHFHQFAQAQRAALEPEELKTLSRPVVGYIGGIRNEIDQTLLREVSARLPRATFVMVGPLQTDVAELASARNLVFLGPRKHQDLPLYIRRFDVGIIPYRINDYTAHIYPAKLNEYLAMGIPVVSTDLPEIRHLNAEFGPVVRVARDAGEFAHAIEGAINDGSAQARQRRIEVARQNDWPTRITKMWALVEAQLSARQTAEQPWQESLLRLYRRTRRHVLEALAVVLVGFAVFFHSPCVWLVAEPLRIVQPARAADAIVVFAGGVGESGRVGGGSQELVKHAVDLYQAHRAPSLVFSSGYRFVFREVRVMKEMAIALGVPASAILLETQATNTHQNVTLVSDILHREGWRTILLVSSPYHMRRAVWTFRKIAPDIQVVATPVPKSQFYTRTHGATLEQINGILHEYAGIVYYWWHGWI